MWCHKGHQQLSQVRDNNQLIVVSSSKYAEGPKERKHKSKTHPIGGGWKQKAEFYHILQIVVFILGIK